MERSNGAVKTAFDIQVNGKHGPGRPKMTWKQLTERDRRELKLSAIDPHDRHLEIWCEICHACSKPVAWKGAHCCGYGPFTCTLIKNPMMMMIRSVPLIFQMRGHNICFMQNSPKLSLIINNTPLSRALIQLLAPQLMVFDTFAAFHIVYGFWD